MSKKLKRIEIDKIEYYTDESDNILGMSQRGLSRLCGISDAAIIDLIKKLNITIWSFKNNFGINIIPLDSCKHIAMKYITQNKGNELTYKFLDIPNKFIKKNTKNNRTEDTVRNKLQEQIGGLREIITLAGNIDLLTDIEIIEVKNVKSWKHALGQILIYSVYYPNHQKRIHLFGECQVSYLNFIEEHCEKYNIKVTWEK